MKPVFSHIFRDAQFNGVFKFDPYRAIGNMFSNTAVGSWYDPTDISTMFQDSAGTTPVTAPGQLVGLRLEKSKGLALGAELVVNGDFSSGTTTGWTAANSATLSVVSGKLSVAAAPSVDNAQARTSFSTVVGLTYRVSVYIEAVSGSRSAVNIGTFAGGSNLPGLSQLNRTGTFSFVFVAITTTTHLAVAAFDRNTTVLFDDISIKELAGNHAVQATAGARLTYGIEPKTGTRNLLLATDTLATQSVAVTAAAHTLAFTGTGTVTLSGASTAGPLVGTGANNRVSLTFTPTAASLTLTVSGSVTLGQLQLGSVDTPYQKVVTAFEVTEAGVPTCHYCAYAGANSMGTSAINFTATNKMSVFIGMRKLSDTAQMLMELSANAGSNPGSFYVYNDTNTRIEGALNNGAATFGYQTSGVPAPTSQVLSFGFDTSGTTRAGEVPVFRRNGAQDASVDSGVYANGTSNFGNFSLYIGRRNNASLPFVGRDYGIIVVGKSASSEEISNAEAFLANNTPNVTL